LFISSSSTEALLLLVSFAEETTEKATAAAATVPPAISAARPAERCWWFWLWSLAFLEKRSSRSRRRLAGGDADDEIPRVDALQDTEPPVAALEHAETFERITGGVPCAPARIPRRTARASMAILFSSFLSSQPIEMPLFF
jgi:hypothetical protein